MTLNEISEISIPTAEDCHIFYGLRINFYLNLLIYLIYGILSMFALLYGIKTEAFSLLDYPNIIVNLFYMAERAAQNLLI